MSVKPERISIEAKAPFKVRLCIDSVKWVCRVTGTQVDSTVCVEWSSKGSSATLEFNSVVEYVRRLASERKWVAEELAAAIARGLAEALGGKVAVSMSFCEDEDVSVEVEASWGS